LPFHRIQRAHELGEIDLEENPAPAGFGSRNEPTLGARADFFGMHAEEGGGFVEIERSHGIGRGGVLPTCRAGRATSHMAQMAMF
jgi:hypothetical protein